MHKLRDISGPHIFGAAIDISALSEDFADDQEKILDAIVDLAHEFQQAVCVRLGSNDKCYIPVIQNETDFDYISLNPDGVFYQDISESIKSTASSQIRKYYQDNESYYLTIVFVTDGLDHWDYNFLKLSEYMGATSLSIYGYHSSYSEVVYQMYCDGEYDEGIESNPDSKEYYSGDKILDGTGLCIKILDSDMTVFNAPNAKLNTITHSKVGSKHTSKYIFNGLEFGKGRLVLEVVRSYVASNPTITYLELEKVFPKQCQGSSGVFSAAEQAKEVYTKLGKKRHFLEPQEIIKLSDCEIAVSSQWEVKNIERFLEMANKVGCHAKLAKLAKLAKG